MNYDRHNYDDDDDYDDCNGVGSNGSILSTQLKHSQTLMRISAEGAME